MALVKCRTWFNQEKWLPAEQLVQRPSAYGLALHNAQVLVVQVESTHRYILPGGGIEKGEEIEDALAREFREETGLAVQVGEFLHFETDFFYYDPHDLAIHGFMFYYRCTPFSTELIKPEYTPDEGLVQPLWIPIESLTPDSFQVHGETILSLLDRIR